jgi:hypothetical protein
MSAPKVDSFFVLADRARKTANILFRENQMEDAALNVQRSSADHRLPARRPAACS